MRNDFFLNAILKRKIKYYRPSYKIILLRERVIEMNLSEKQVLENGSETWAVLK